MRLLAKRIAWPATLPPTTQAEARTADLAREPPPLVAGAVAGSARSAPGWSCATTLNVVLPFPC